MNRLIIIITAFLIMSGTAVFPEQQKIFILVEEDKDFWNQILNDNSIANKNMLYAGYVAYKENLNDLSIETFKEYINTNSTNGSVVTLANYYMAKNLYSIGKFPEAVQEFVNVSKSQTIRYDNIKYASMINAAIAYYKLNNIDKFRESLQEVISSDVEGKYKRIALDILSQQ